MPDSSSSGTRLVLLGTMAGPMLHPARMMTSQAIVVDGIPYLVDCGYGAVERLTRAGLSPGAIRALFLTHHHSDHTADYPALTHLAWIQAGAEPMSVFGPPPMLRMHEAALAFNREDAAIRIAATGRDPVERKFSVSEIQAEGPVYSDERVRVSCALVDHPPFSHAFAFRFDAQDRSVVVSGDTAPSEALVQLARGADVLVHEAMYVPGIDAMLARRAYVPPKLRDFLMEGHTHARDCGRVAARAGVKTLVLSHLLPGDDASVADEIWRAEAAQAFDGEIIVGRDLLAI